MRVADGREHARSGGERHEPQPVWKETLSHSGFATSCRTSASPAGPEARVVHGRPPATPRRRTTETSAQGELPLASTHRPWTGGSGPEHCRTPTRTCFGPCGEHGSDRNPPLQKGSSAPAHPAPAFPTSPVPHASPAQSGNLPARAPNPLRALALRLVCAASCALPCPCITLSACHKRTYTTACSRRPRSHTRMPSWGEHSLEGLGSGEERGWKPKLTSALPGGLGWGVADRRPRAGWWG